MDTKVADPLREALLGGRYRITGRLASGPATSVYQARDERLDRSVAIRIVNAEHVLDADVLDRLANEARTVAHLAHPNIVAVFDQGTHEGAPYVVMEYVHGRSLREVVSDRGRLDPAESLAIVEQVLAALAVAHRAGLVHRAVKPENILVAPPPNGSGDLVDAVVKVADFGLARAADIGRSQVNPMLGTTPYLAPELIADGRADTRADVYSVGVVLFELLTGRLPFADASSPDAWRHVDEDAPPPSRFADGIPSGLDETVTLSTRRDPAARPRDASVLLGQIQAAREDVGALAGPTRAIAHPTVVVPPVADRPSWSRLPAPRASGRVAPRTGARVRDADETVGTMDRARTALAGAGDRLRNTSRRLRYTRQGRRVLIASVVVLGILLMVGGWWVGIGRYTSAPSLLALTKDNAIAEADRLGFEIAFGAPRYDENVPADTVLTQQPPPCGRVPRGGTLTVYLSLGPERYVVPEILGQELSFALTRIPDQFVVQQVDGYSDTLPVGYVAATNPVPGSVLAPGQTLEVTVVRGPYPVHVPSVVGKTLNDAKSQLQAAGFTQITVEQRDDAEAAKDEVLEQTPSGGAGMASAEGQAVTLVVANGPKAKMPNVVGRGCNDAVAALQALHLRVEVDGNPIDQQLGNVKAQDPPPDTDVATDQQVKITCRWP
jgi:eukaryotic-like serine/threonine-protein kinase